MKKSKFKYIIIYHENVTCEVERHTVYELTDKIKKDMEAFLLDDMNRFISIEMTFAGYEEWDKGEKWLG